MAEEHDDSLCHCGTIKDAVEAARKEYITLAAANCPTYALAYATALRALAVEAIIRPDHVSVAIPRKDIQVACNHFSDRTKELVDINQLIQDTIARREYLHN